MGKICCLFGGISLESSIVICSNELITRALYQSQLIALTRAIKKKVSITTPNTTILFSCKIVLVLAAPVKTYLETLNWKIQPHLSYSPVSIVNCSDLWHMAYLNNTFHHMKINLWIGSKYEESHFICYQEIEKKIASDGQYFE